MNDNRPKKQNGKPFTIKQIAMLAGVSPGTVSHALNGREHKMSPETLKKIMQTLEETNYVSNMGGRILAQSGSKLIGVIMMYGSRNERNAIQDPFFSEIIGALEREIRTSGYFMMIYISGDVEESLRMAAAWNIEGLIVLGSSADACARFMEGSRVPLVFIDSYFHSDGIAYVNVGLHDRRGGYMMTQYLLSQGHRRIAFLADQQVPVGVDYERMQGYKAALNEAGIPFHEADYVPFSHRYTQRHEQLRTFVSERMHAYSALFFASDFYAVDGINVLLDEGLSVPKDMSVAGFDDNIYAVQSRPKLTTVRQDVSKKATYAVAQLLRILRNEPISSRNIRLPVSLEIRASVGRV